MSEAEEASIERNLNFDPPAGRRVYVRNQESGQLGWLVRRGGATKVRLDRESHEILVDHDARWVQEVSVRRVSHSQLVGIAFEADRALLKTLGLHAKSRKDFVDLTEEQRRVWFEEGPSQPPIRRILYKTILDVLSEHMVE